MSGVARFEPYAVPRGTECITIRNEGGGAPGAPGIATAFRTVDKTAAEVAELRRDNARLRREAANHHATAEAERAESARLRRESQGFAVDWASANNELAALKDALAAAVGIYDCACGSAWEFADGFGIEDYAALNRWLGRHGECKA